MTIEHSDINLKKIVKNVWIASCTVTNPLKATVEMKGVSEEDAKNKLLKFLGQNK